VITLVRRILFLAIAAGTIGDSYADSRLLADLHPGSTSSFDYDSAESSLPSAYLGGLTYFVTLGCQVWQTDGTSANTSMMVDLSGGSDPTCMGEVSRVNNRLLLTSGYSLWMSDGTGAGTSEMITPDIHGVREVVPWQGSPGWSVISSYNFDTDTFEVWATNGTSAGTTLLATVGDTEFPTLAFLSEQRLAIGGHNGLWLATSPSLPATKVGSGFTSVDHLVGMITDGKSILFMATDSAHGEEVWYSDMTDIGTHIIRDFTPGTSGTTNVKLAGVNEGLFYFTVGDVLWRADGTATAALTTAGQVIAKPVIASIGNITIFTGQENDGYHLWKTNGTAIGTQRYTTAPEVNDPIGQIVTFSDALYVIKNQSGINAFMTQGMQDDLTPVGTRPIQFGSPTRLGRSVIVPGQAVLGIFRRDEATPYTTTPMTVGASVNSNIFIGGPVLYFGANMTTTGIEPHAVDLPDTAASICSSPNLSIPDNTNVAANDLIEVPQHAVMKNLTVDLRVSHTYIGDLSAFLNHIDANGQVRTVQLLARPIGCASNDLDVVFDDLSTDVPGSANCSTDTHAQAFAAGTKFRPPQALAGFVGDDLNGKWILQVFDSANRDVGGITQWCLDTTGKSDVIFKNGYETPVP
jgi:ELWxxDGT repeat protein